MDVFFGFLEELGFGGSGWSPRAIAAARLSSRSLLLGRPRFFLGGSRISEGES